MCPWLSRFKGFCTKNRQTRKCIGWQTSWFKHQTRVTPICAKAIDWNGKGFNPWSCFIGLKISSNISTGPLCSTRTSNRAVLTSMVSLWDHRNSASFFHSLLSTISSRWPSTWVSPRPINRLKFFSKVRSFLPRPWSLCREPGLAINSILFQWLFHRPV